MRSRHRYPSGMTNLNDLAAHWRVLPQDLDPVETREWLEGFDALLQREGPERASFILRKLLDHARAKRAPNSKGKTRCLCVVRGVVVVACGPCDSETVAQDKFSSKCYKVCLKERNPEIELISIGSCL